MAGATEVETGYIHIRPHGFIDRQKTIGPGVVLDLDDEDNVVGIETIGEVKLSEILFRLLTVAKVPRSIH